MEEILHQLIVSLSVYPIIYRVLAPSQVVQDFFHQQYVRFREGILGIWSYHKPWSCAAWPKAGDMAMCELLLDRGADIDAKCSWGSPISGQRKPTKKDGGGLCSREANYNAPKTNMEQGKNRDVWITSQDLRDGFRT